jgi:hypothetical protein
MNCESLKNNVNKRMFTHLWTKGTALIAHTTLPKGKVLTTKLCQDRQHLKISLTLGRKNTIQEGQVYETGRELRQLVLRFHCERRVKEVGVEPKIWINNCLNRILNVNIIQQLIIETSLNNLGVILINLWEPEDSRKKKRGFIFTWNLL